MSCQFWNLTVMPWKKKLLERNHVDLSQKIGKLPPKIINSKKGKTPPPQKKNTSILGLPRFFGTTHPCICWVLPSLFFIVFISYSKRHNVRTRADIKATLTIQSMEFPGSLNRWQVAYNHPIGNIYHLYTSYIFHIAFWGVLCYLPPFMGTRNNH